MVEEAAAKTLLPYRRTSSSGRSTRSACRQKITDSTTPRTIGTSTSGEPRLAPLPSSLRPYTVAAEPAGSSSRPSTSSLPAGPDSVWGMMRQPAMNAITPIGTFTRKIQDQCRFSRIRPPTTGPRIGASIAGIETIGITRPIR